MLYVYSYCIIPQYLIFRESYFFSCVPYVHVACVNQTLSRRIEAAHPILFFYAGSVLVHAFIRYVQNYVSRVYIRVRVPAWIIYIYIYVSLEL